jgi:hypothetical protein
MNQTGKDFHTTGAGGAWLASYQLTVVTYHQVYTECRFPAVYKGLIVRGRFRAAEHVFNICGAELGSLPPYWNLVIWLA